MVPFLREPVIGAIVAGGAVVPSSSAIFLGYALVSVAR